VVTRTHTPRFCGFPASAGAFDLVMTFALPFLTNWLIVGIKKMKETFSFQPSFRLL